MQELHIHEDRRDPLVIALMVGAIIMLFVTALGVWTIWLTQQNQAKQIRALEDQFKTQTQVDANQNRQIQFVKAQQEIANGKSSVQGSD